MTAEQPTDGTRAFTTLVRIQQAIADPELSVEEKIQRVLTIGAESLGFPIAYFTHIDGETQRIVTAVGDTETVWPGATDPLEETYCRSVVEGAETVVMTDLEAEGWADDPATDRFGFGCYVGTPVTIRDELYGTICFADETPREDVDPTFLRTTVRTIARIVGYELDRERYERVLQKRKQRLRLFERAVEQSGHAVLITDREGTITYVNPAFESQTGYSREEATGLSPRILKSGKHSEEFYTALWETILSGDQWRADIVNRRKSGELYRVDQEITPITDEDGEITHFLSIQSDVTSRRLREQQLAVLNRILRHNLRNGTNIAEGYVSLLEDDIDDDLENYLEAIADQATSLSRLGVKANAVRSLFEQGISATDSRAVEDVLATLAADFDRQYPDATLEIEAPEALYVKADDRLRVALWELLDNAVVHSDRSTPTVSITATPSSANWAGEWVDIVVADDGPGIPAQEQTTIETGQETSLEHGSGLGLWIVYWAISLLGGEISLQDNEPQGSRVVVTLPRVDT